MGGTLPRRGRKEPGATKGIRRTFPAAQHYTIEEGNHSFGVHSHFVSSILRFQPLFSGFGLVGKAQFFSAIRFLRASFYKTWRKIGRYTRHVDLYSRSHLCSFAGCIFVAPDFTRHNIFEHNFGAAFRRVSTFSTCLRRNTLALNLQTSWNAKNRNNVQQRQTI